jgi:hypothetical protein
MAQGIGSGQEANPFFANSPPPPGQVLWAAGWIGAVLVAGVVAFRRREL